MLLFHLRQWRKRNNSVGLVGPKTKRSSNCSVPELLLQSVAIRRIVAVFLLLCIITLNILSPKTSTYDEVMQIPYTVRRSSFKKGTRWILQNSRATAKKITTSFKLDDNNSGLNPPHPVQSYPNFQERMYKLTAENWRDYERKLLAFSQKSFPKKLASWSIDSVKSYSPSAKYNGFLSRTTIPSHIWQTGKKLPTMRNSFQERNPGSTYHFFDDHLLETWTQQHFNESLIKEVWDKMERPVLKADFWRYLVVFLEGGFYSDTDTDCLKPVNQWGNIDAITWDLGGQVDPDIARRPPQVVVGIEVDVPDVTGWETFWPRPIQIVQWTMSGAPGHPIYLDSIRRVVESMRSIGSWERQRKEKANYLFSRLTLDDSTLKERLDHFKDQEIWDQLRELLTVDPFDKENGGPMSLIEATGPGAFSDAVFSYLKARYGIHWSQLHNIQTATRIGEVAILPITGFAPFWKPDWQRWKGLSQGPMSVVGDIQHPQAMVNHHFSGSWRKDTDNAA